MVSQLPLEIAGMVSVWFEALLYGIYCSLFFEAMYIIVKKKIMSKTLPSKVFFIGSVLMFIIATIHIALNLYRLLKGYIWLVDTVKPETYFLDLGRWENVAHNAFNAIMTWIADFLVIYRCFLVWNNNYYIIIVPSLLVIMSIISNAIALDLFTKVPFGTIFGPNLIHWMNTIYALALVQNTMTTGLIAYRIWAQERDTRRVGIHSNGSKSSLMPIVRIIVESAAIYSLELLVLIILYALGHNGQFVVQEAVVPTVGTSRPWFEDANFRLTASLNIGIVFTLMTVRIAMRSSKSLATTEVQSPTIRWRRYPGTDTTATTEFPMTVHSVVTTDAIDLKPTEDTYLETDMSMDKRGPYAA
ncbi:hypothetical protein HGRIS_002123 [Hohenbuehelia grisea]|uniref:Uncharacterized protein n=1 Tax=Hohenbuehelia grisea TaxID=104357 RepID=A0ABR3JKR2_9AGAR